MRSWPFAHLKLLPLALLLSISAAATPVAAQLSLPGGNSPTSPDRDELLLPTPSVDTALRPSERRADFSLPGTSVMQRKRSAYDPIGIRSGAFTVFPYASAGIGFNSNLYAAPDDTSDVFGLASVGADALSNWEGRSLAFGARVSGRAYAGGNAEDGLSQKSYARGRIEISRNYRLGARISQESVLTDRRAIEEDLVTYSPIRFHRSEAAVDGSAQSGRLQVAGSAGWSRYDYRDTRNSVGTPINMQYRDFTSVELGAEISYQVSPGMRVYVGANDERRRYRLKSNFDRDTRTTSISAGLSGGITALIRGQVGVRYSKVDFADPSFRTRDFFGVDADLTYLFTELTTIRLTAKRDNRVTSSATSPAVLVTRFALGADHELLRNLILSADLVDQRADYIATERSIEQLRLELAAAWLLNRNLRLGAKAEFVVADGENYAFDRDYSGIETLVTLTWQR